eukprot:11189917-Lingulodinium_polyedra.AAC.1
MARLSWASGTTWAPSSASRRAGPPTGSFSRAAGSARRPSWAPRSPGRCGTSTPRGTWPTRAAARPTVESCSRVGRSGHRAACRRRQATAGRWRRPLGLSTSPRGGRAEHRRPRHWCLLRVETKRPRIPAASSHRLRPPEIDRDGCHK